MPWGLRMMLILTALAMIFQLYVARKTANAVEAVTGWPRKRVRLTVAVVIVWIILYPAILLASYYMGWSNVSAALQRSNMALAWIFTYPYWIGIILAVQLAMFFLLVDIIRLLFFPVYRKNKPRWRLVQSWVVIALVGLISVYAVARVYNDTFTVRTRATELQIKDLPAELEGFRIVQVADLQADAPTQWNKLQPYIDTVNNLKPDLVLFGGDLVTSGVDYIEMGAEAMGKIEARHGVYACLGDHDHFSNRDMVIRALEGQGVTVLDNLAAVVPVGSSYISVTGITWVYRTRPTERTLDVIDQQRMRGPVNIMLAHQPANDLVKYASEKGYDLFVAGHTHGGQVVFPLPGFLLTGSSFETRYVSGFYHLGDMFVSVNNGLGLTLAPIRYHAPAEVTLITLTAAK